MIDNKEKEYIFYHGTSLDNWNKIKEEGILFGRRGYINEDNKVVEVDRCTYLAVDKEEAECYGDVILRVNYNPYNDKKHNNYCPRCWQLRVYSPIPLSQVERIK